MPPYHTQCGESAQGIASAVQENNVQTLTLVTYKEQKIKNPFTKIVYLKGNDHIEETITFQITDFTFVDNSGSKVVYSNKGGTQTSLNFQYEEWLHSTVAVGLAFDFSLF